MFISPVFTFIIHWIFKFKYSLKPSVVDARKHKFNRYPVCMKMDVMTVNVHKAYESRLKPLCDIGLIVVRLIYLRQSRVWKLAKALFAAKIQSCESPLSTLYPILIPAANFNHHRNDEMLAQCSEYRLSLAEKT